MLLNFIAMFYSRLKCLFYQRPGLPLLTSDHRSKSQNTIVFRTDLENWHRFKLLYIKRKNDTGSFQPIIKNCSKLAKTTEKSSKVSQNAEKGRISAQGCSNCKTVLQNPQSGYKQNIRATDHSYPLKCAVKYFGWSLGISNAEGTNHLTEVNWPKL